MTLQLPDAIRDRALALRGQADTHQWAIGDLVAEVVDELASRSKTQTVRALAQDIGVGYSTKIAKNIVYLMPIYKVFASGKFLDELFVWGGIRQIRRYGTGTQWGFPFGHALAAVHYQRDYMGNTYWSRYQPTPAQAEGA